VVDGEIVLATEAGLDFEALQQRIHPAASRVAVLSTQTPASFIAFDLLAVGEEDLTGQPFAQRRTALEQILRHARPPVHLTPATTDRDVALRWFAQFDGAGLDGVVAKSLDGVYEPDNRVMFKIKHERTADCVVAGYRRDVAALRDAGDVVTRYVNKTWRTSSATPPSPHPRWSTSTTPSTCSVRRCNATCG
jgi:ATP-dependent DNA ligase